MAAYTLTNARTGACVVFTSLLAAGSFLAMQPTPKEWSVS